MRSFSENMSLLNVLEQARDRFVPSAPSVFGMLAEVFEE